MKFPVPLTLFLLFLAPLATSTVIAQTLPIASVVSTGDGDTLQVNQGGRSITVRLGCIDAPERSQPGGSEAAQRLRQLLPRGQAVQIRQIDTDRYGRQVAELYLNGQSLNLQLVQEGQAVVYRQYLSRCSATQNQYLQAEQQARSSRLGFWAQANQTMPWDWRQGQRATPSTPTRPNLARPTPAQPTSNLPTCVNSDCDCSDFRSQIEAQRVFNQFPDDPFRLDRDGDGRVCEGR